MLTLRLADIRINDLQNRDREGRRFTRSRLGLRNGIATFADLHDGARLHRGGGFVAVSVDAAEEVLFQMHVLEGRSHRDLLGGGELHALIVAAIDSFGHGGTFGCLLVA